MALVPWRKGGKRMAQTVMIWTLNRATWLIRPNEKRLIAAVEGGLWDRLRGRRVDCIFGDRSAYNIANYKLEDKKDVPRHQLMYEAPDCNEYFVPIPLKCIGSLYKKANVLSGAPRELLEKTVGAKPYFKQQEFEAYWEERGHPDLPQARMNTRDYLGYYDILAQTGCQNILIGYSQGGLVARYLAFLDEHVFQKNAIAGIITVQAPNFGSPLANDENCQTVIDGINALLLNLISIPRTHFGKFHKKVNDNINFEHLISIIDTMLDDLRDPTALTRDQLKMRDTLVTARKWLGGLHSNQYNAFYDLNIRNFERDPYSVLNTVNAYPLKRIHAGAVVGVNNDLDDFFSSFMEDLFARFIKGWFYKAVWDGFRKKKLLGASIGENIANAGKVYREKIMEESRIQNGADTSNQFVREVVERYRGEFTVPNGSKKATVAARKHDFIIPAASQILPVQDSGKPLVKNRVNALAGHNSGGDPEQKPGKKNVAYILAMLQDFKRTLV